LLTVGRIPVGQLTGDTNTHNKMGAYLVGRNSDSGTRLSVLGEVGYGANTKPIQYLVNSTSEIVQYPAETINGLALTIGQSGYASGGNVAGCFTNNSLYPLVSASLQVGNAAGVRSTTPFTNGAFIIGYAGVGDTRASGGVNRANCKPLTFNGVSNTPANIINGYYSLWTYEHLYANPSASTLARVVMKSIGDSCLTTATAPNAAVRLSDMKCSRTGDARPVAALY